MIDPDMMRRAAEAQKRAAAAKGQQAAPHGGFKEILERLQKKYGTVLGAEPEERRVLSRSAAAKIACETYPLMDSFTSMRHGIVDPVAHTRDIILADYPGTDHGEITTLLEKRFREMGQINAPGHKEPDGDYKHGAW